MKTKHNKKRNTAIIFETLIQEYTKNIISKDKEKQFAILSLIKESFSKESYLLKDLKIYKSILETYSVDELTAEKILAEAKKQKQLINEEQLLKEQNILNKKIKNQISSNIFNNFIPNYKQIASIYQIFSKSTPIKTKILLENSICKEMLNKEPEDKMVPIDNLVFKTFIKRFNETYNSALLNEQKQLLKHYIFSFSNNAADLKVFLNEEIGRLKDELSKSLELDEFKTDSSIKYGLQEIIKKISNYKDKEIDSSLIKEILKIQNLLGEIQNGNNN